MRRDLVASSGKFVWRRTLQLLAQGANLLLQSVYLLLLAKYGVVERIEQFLRKAYFSLELVQSSFHYSYSDAAALKHVPYCNAASHAPDTVTRRMPCT